MQQQKKSFFDLIGNDRLRLHMLRYNVPENSPVEFKFKVKATQYYRDIVIFIIIKKGRICIK
jgi:hypothetical protein